MIETELAEAVHHKRILQAQLKSLEQDITDLESELLTAWTEQGLSQAKVKTQYGPYVLYCSTRTYAHMEFPSVDVVGDKFPSLLSVNHAKTSSLLTEMMASGNEEGLAELAAAGITPNEVTKINVKRG